jgi:cbb3-type cytochrome oxidase subunit 3
MRDLLPHNLEIGLEVLISTPIFAMFFVALVYWTYKSSRKDTYKRIERLPLDDDKNQRD